jgi:hypothetical protein
LLAPFLPANKPARRGRQPRGSGRGAALPRVARSVPEVTDAEQTVRRKTICCATSTQMPDLGLELVASFAHGLHLVQYEEQTPRYAARLPRERLEEKRR